MSTITVELDIGIWLNNKGEIQIFQGDCPVAIETVPLLDLIKMEIESNKYPGQDYLDWDEAKKYTKLKKALLNCTAHMTNEMLNAK